MTFSQNLRAALDARKWTPAHLSAALVDADCPTTVQSIDLWLAGNRFPRVETLTTIARVLNTSPDVLLGFGPVDTDQPAADTEAA